MALGDGVRRDIATVSQAERDRFRDAMIALNQRDFPGARTEFPAGGVSRWFKQDEIHQATHVHRGPAFLPWHREICNRFEAMLREVDPDLSLHYWDWNTDPTPLFTNTFMGSANGDAGEPWLSAGLYDPTIADDSYRDNSIHGLNQSPPGYSLHANPADPPKALTRNKQAGAPPVGQTVNGSTWPTDADLVAASSWDAFNDLMQGCERGTSNNCAHGMAHGYIGGTIGNPHTSFRDPFVFLIHSNVDRLWAMWQTQPGHPERLNPAQVYDTESSSAAINSPLQPWAGEATWTSTGGWPVRPWYTPENQQIVKDCKHPSIVSPPCYDTLPTHPATVTLETATINFNDVPAGETAARAVVFSAVSCDDVHLSISAGPTLVSGPAGTAFGTFPDPPGTNAIVPHLPSTTPPRGRIWISYKGTAPLDAATGTVTIHCAETNQDFVVPITANTITRPTVATMLVLDQSGSMGWLAGIDATTKRIDVLHGAASTFVQLVQRYPGDAVGMVSFDNNAYPGVPVTQYTGGPFDLLAVQNGIQALAPQGATSIGGGVALGRSNLNPVTGYDRKALIVFTDGLENTAPYIADVMGSVDAETFAIGLGTAQQVSTGALNALTNSTGGYVLLSGILSPSIDDQFRLAKYFLQILAGVTNNNIVTDPSGYLAPGMTARIPFQLNEADIDATVILLSDLPVVRLLVETPDGDVMDPAAAIGLGATYEARLGVSFYRFTLPLALGGRPAQPGTWYALLELDRKGREQLTHRDTSVAAMSARTHGVRYCVTIQSYSNLRLQTRLAQDGMAPGANLRLRATLREYDMPVARRATVRADLELPDGSHTSLALTEVDDGVFAASAPTSVEGVYRFHVYANGMTMRGLPFTREQLLTGAVFVGGNNRPPTSDPARGRGDQLICDLLRCLLHDEALVRSLTSREIDIDHLRRCFEASCAKNHELTEAEALEREGITLAQEAAATTTAALDPELLQALTSALESRLSIQVRQPKKKGKER